MCRRSRREAHPSAARGRESATGGHRTYGFGWLRLLIRESVPPENLISVSRTIAPSTPLAPFPPARRCPSRYPVNTLRGSPLTGTDLGLRRQVAHAFSRPL